jgi:hypothetical protein
MKIVFHLKNKIVKNKKLQRERKEKTHNPPQQERKNNDQNSKATKS